MLNKYSEIQKQESRKVEINFWKIDKSQIFTWTIIEMEILSGETRENIFIAVENIDLGRKSS